MANPVGASAGSQRWVAKGERSGLLDAHCGDGKRFIVRADEKLTAFMELEHLLVSQEVRRKNLRQDQTAKAN